MARLKGPEGLVAEVVEYKPTATLEALERLEKLRRRRSVQAKIAGLADLEQPELLGVALDDLGKDEDADGSTHPFRADVVDRATGTHYALTGQLDAPGNAVLTPVPTAYPPRKAEINAAIRALRRDPRVGAAIRRGDLVASPAMPGAVVTSGPRRRRPRRAITIGLIGNKHPDGGAYRIVDVDPLDGTVLGTHDRAAHADCGSPDDGDPSNTSTGGMVKVTVQDANKTLWELVVIRPNAIDANNGVGLSVREVFYKGRKVLHRADTPIVNVRYDTQNESGATSYRDWLNEEAGFRATGTDVIPGYRLCRRPPKTLFDEDRSGHTRAGGNFAGVSFHWDGTTLVATTLLAAGWYRYRVEWRFASDGTITPTFGFDAVVNPNTCSPHTHHCYWRLDFDIDTAGNNAVKRRVGSLGSHFTVGDPKTLPQRLKDIVELQWQAVNFERRMVRTMFSAWQVLNVDSGYGYAVYPSVRDGHADAGFGVGDVWALRYHAGQDADANPGAGDEAHLDPYVNHEKLDRADVVLWYAGHARHDQHEDDLHDVHGHVVGPELAPVKW
jgi:hypothetical protein